MSENLDHIAALRAYLEKHEEKRRQRARDRPGHTHSTMPTLFYDPASETPEQRLVRQIAEWDGNMRDLNGAAGKALAGVAHLYARVGVLEAQPRTIPRWELVMVLGFVLGVGFVGGAAAVIALGLLLG